MKNKNVTAEKNMEHLQKVLIIKMTAINKPYYNFNVIRCKMFRS